MNNKINHSKENINIQFLKQAYLDTTYRIYLNTDYYLDLKIGIYNKKLADLLKNSDMNNWCIITAFNPYSQQLTEKENLAKNAIMKKTLKKLPCKIYKAKGIPSENNWLPEESFFVIGLNRNKFIELGIKFKQNAIVLGNKNAIPELTWLIDLAFPG